MLPPAPASERSNVERAEYAVRDEQHPDREYRIEMRSARICKPEGEENCEESNTYHGNALSSRIYKDCLYASFAKQHHTTKFFTYGPLFMRYLYSLRRHGKMQVIEWINISCLTTVSGQSGSNPAESEPRRGENMLLEWVLGFLVLAILAAIFGFGGIARGAAGIAKVLFVVFLVLLIVGFFL